MQADTFDTALEDALRYAAIGWHVFPCAPTKRPYTEHGFHDATTDAEVIRSWWAKWPGAKVGVACLLSGVFVVDLDHRPDKARNGVEAWEIMQEDNGSDGAGLVASTPSGGKHIVYLHPGFRIATVNNVVQGSGIDVRGDGGYFIAPSAVDEARQWVVGDPLEVGDDGSLHIGDAPQWVLDLVAAREEHGAGTGNAEGGDSAKEMPIDERQLADIRDALRFIDNYDREPWIRVGMALKSTGAGMQAFRIWREWSSACREKFDEKTQWKQWRSLREYRWNGSEITLGTLFHMAKEGGWVPTLEQTTRAADSVFANPVSAPADDGYRPQRREDRAPFPKHLLNIPGVLGDLAEWIKDCGLREQPALALASAIATCGAIVGRRVATPTNLRTNFYIVGVGETASGKEAGVSEPVNILKAAGLERFLGTSDWTSDSGIRTSLQKNASQLCTMDEFGKWLRKVSGERCPPHVVGIKKMLLESFSRASGVMRGVAYANAKDNPVVDIVEPNLCVYGASTPSDVFGALDSGALSDGWLNRFLFFFIDDQIPPMRKMTLVVTGERERRRDRVCQQLRQLEELTRPEGDLVGVTNDGTTKTGCRVVEWSAKADAMMDGIHLRTDEKRRTLSAEGKQDNATASEMWARYALHVAKLAMLHAVTDDPTRQVEEHDVQWADELATWCTERTIAECGDRLSDNQTQQKTLKVRGVIWNTGDEGISGSALSRKTYWLNRSERAATIASLVEGGEVVAVTKQTGGRPSTTYYGAQYAPANEGQKAFFDNANGAALSTNGASLVAATP